MAIKKRCVICGTFFMAHRNNQKYCCEECSYKGKQETWRRSERKKKEREQEKNRANVLDTVLDEARARGMTYAEYQMAKTLQKVAKGEL